MPHRAEQAVTLLERSLKLEPDYAAAHALLGWCHELCYSRGGFDKAEKDAALLHARATIASDNDDAAALAIAGFALAMCSEHEAGLAALDRAINLNPSSATALYLGAQAHSVAGDGDAAAALADRALLLSPFDPLAFQAHMALGELALERGRYDDAATCFGRAAQNNPGFSTAWLWQGMAMGLAGREKEARLIIQRGLELEPGYRAARGLFEGGLAATPLAQRIVEGARLLDVPL